MGKLTVEQIEKSIKTMSSCFNKDNFIYDLLLSYGLPKSSITRLKKGDYNMSKEKGEIAWRKRLLFKEVDKEDVHDTIDALMSNPSKLKCEPRFIIVTDYNILLSFDTKTSETLDIQIKDIIKNYDFFLPWAGIEKAQYQRENHADVKAAERMAKLYDEIKKDNPINTEKEAHELNVFLSRLLFCFFAEDTGIFKEGLFTNSIKSYTQNDGSDLNTYINKLFKVLDTKEKDNIPVYLKRFEYVNGGLFRDTFKVPVFTRRSRQAIIECGELNWSEINPDIFGSMIQAVVTPEYRDIMGMHYTSTSNIMKVIKPLFLDNLYEDFDKIKNNETKLKNFSSRLSRIKIFDPACGSGNFLIIAYKEIRRLEMKVYKQLNDISDQRSIHYSLYQSQISLHNFHGIELDDFAHEIAILSLWLAQHQMNLEFLQEFGYTRPTLPLEESAKIIYGNATRLKWGEVCPKEEDSEIYILGNPPYLGARLLEDYQKSDMDFVFKESKIKFKDLDYIACWFYIGAKYIQNTNAKYAFVSTNSICQGIQVSILWPEILDGKVEIGFAYQSFKWSNNAKSKAGVTCIIVGLRNKSNDSKFIYNEKLCIEAKNISPYLVDSENIFIKGKKNSLSDLPSMCFGSMPNDGGYLLLNQQEYNEIIDSSPDSDIFIRKFIGAREFINDIQKWCLWINEFNLDKAMDIPQIKERISKVKTTRATSKRKATQILSDVPFRFGEIRHKDTDSIAVPCHSSELRDYIPIGFFDSRSIINNSCVAIYNSEPWIFGVITSKIHMAWVRAVCGKLETRIRYSADICYNTFPFPKISQEQKDSIVEKSYKVLEEREVNSEKNLAQLYDPKKMPEGLREAHHQLDLAVDRCYRSELFKSDEERLEYLFKLYKEMVDAKGEN